MGIEHRDYYRNHRHDYGGPSGVWDMPVVCKRLLITAVIVYIGQMIFTRPMSLQEMRSRWGMSSEESLDAEYDIPFVQKVSVLEDVGLLAPARVARGEIWRVFTYSFLHNRLRVWSILINMVFLYWFGSRLEQMYGATEFCLFYFASATLAALSYLALSFYTGNMAVMEIGASGAVWGLVVLYVIHHPYEQVHVYFLFPIQIRWLALLYLLYDLHPVLLAINGETGFGGAIPRAAHLGGAAFGALYFYRSWRLTPIYDRLRGKASASRWQTRVVRRPPRSTVPFDRGTLDASRREPKPSRPAVDPAAKKLEAQLDEVLEKIQSSGRESLTDEEVQVLEQASQKYRDR